MYHTHNYSAIKLEQQQIRIKKPLHLQIQGVHKVSL